MRRSLWFCWILISMVLTIFNHAAFAQSGSAQSGIGQSETAQSGIGEAAAKDEPALGGPLYWVFLTTGKSTQGTEPAELEKMQGAHLANFGRLHKEGKLFAAGPLADPQKTERGIVVVTAPNLEGLSELFAADPFLKEGFLVLDSIPMEVAVGTFQREIKSEALAEFRLVLLEKSTSDGVEVNAKEALANLEYAVSIHDAERLCFAGWLHDEKLPRRGILIFRKLSDAQLKSLLDDFPAVKSGHWKGTTIPLYMSAEIVK